MNNFAGIIRFQSAADDSYLTSLQNKFPKRLKQLPSINSDALQAIGQFQPSSINNEVPDRSLYFEGEVYNAAQLARQVAYDFSDGNVASLVHKIILDHGIEMLAQLNGQFLIVYINKQEKTVHLLTDQSGVQQVFYHEGKDFFLFASDIKFLLAHPECPCTIDWESSLRRPQPNVVLNSYRSFRTWFQDIHLLPEAVDCCISYVEKTVKQSRFWNGLYDYELSSPDDKRTAADAMEEYMALLDDAVKIRTQGTGPAYSFLSGGLDSSAICGLAAKHKPLETFSIITQTTCIEDTTSVCHNLGQELGFKNTQFFIPYHELAFNKELWKKRIWRTESPVNHTDALTKNMLHYGISQTQVNVPYVLTGTGSDQYNGGLVRWVVSDDENAASFLNRVKDSQIDRMVTLDDDNLKRMRKLMTHDYMASISKDKLERNSWMYYVQSALHGETYSLVWDELRAASAHGRTARFPFLDYRFAKFIASVPERLHAELFYDKPILREPSRKILPDYVTNKSKVPAFIPGYDFRGRLYDFLTSGPDSLLVAAFGERGTKHPVVNTEVLWQRVDAMKIKGSHYEWNDLMHIINLGILEQLADKTEADLDFERDMKVPEVISFNNREATKTDLHKRLGIRTEEQMLALPLLFNDDCGLMLDYRKGTLFIAKNNTLAYEIEEEYATWKALLEGIDGKKSTREILNETGGHFDTVREFFMLAMKEEILKLDLKTVPAKTETANCEA